MIIVDSDIIIWYLRGREDIRRAFDESAEQTGGLLYITPIQLCEVTTGLRPVEAKKTNAVLRDLPILAIDQSAGFLAGEMRHLFWKSHQLSLADALIAAVTRINRLKLWTLNRKHFPALRSDEFHTPS